MPFVKTNQIIKMTNLEYLNLQNIVNTKFSRSIVILKFNARLCLILGIMLLLFTIENIDQDIKHRAFFALGCILMIVSFSDYILLGQLKNTENRLLDMVSAGFEKGTSINVFLEKDGPFFTELLIIEKNRTRKGTGVTPA